MSTVRIVLLGGLAIERDAREAGHRGLPGRRAELVFAYLAAEHRREVSRDELADALWPGVLPDSWAAALRGVVTEVRRFLEAAGFAAAEVLASSRGGYQLRLPPGVVVDVDEARAALAEARERLGAGAAADAAAGAERAADLAGLPFLPQHDGGWVDGLRRELESIHVAAVELQVRAHASAGDARATAAAAARLVEVDAYNEAAHQLRIRVLAETGDSAGAVKAYEDCRELLASQLGVAPSAQTEAALRRAVEHVPAAEQPVEAAAGLPAYSVLVVEDHEFQRHTVVRLLRRLGVGTIAEAADGAAALAVIAERGPPDVIVCDIDMPGMDGVEFIGHVAERDLASAVIITSGLDARMLHTVESLAGAYGLELLGVVEKPLTARRLGELLRSHGRDPARHEGAEPAATVTVADIGRALAADRVVLRFRPTVDLATGSVGAAAAIGGWHDPAAGFVVAPVLELGELASRFADRVLALACSELLELRRAGLDVAVTIGLSGYGLGDRGLADRFADLASAHGADPGQIAWRVGERTLRRGAAALATLVRLRLKGFGLIIEDFGSGHTSADQLSRLPITAVTVAASIVSGAAGDARRSTALEQALELARGPGVVVGAAGCDSEADFDLLLGLGCSRAEGAFIAEPMTRAELIGWAGRWSPPSPAAPAGTV